MNQRKRSGGWELFVRFSIVLGAIAACVTIYAFASPYLSTISINPPSPNVRASNGDDCVGDILTKNYANSIYTNPAQVVPSDCVAVINSYSGTIAGVDQWDHGKILGLPPGTYNLRITDGKLQIVPTSQGQFTYCDVLGQFQQDPQLADQGPNAPLDGWTCT